MKVYNNFGWTVIVFTYVRPSAQRVHRSWPYVRPQRLPCRPSASWSSRSSRSPGRPSYRRPDRLQCASDWKPGNEKYCTFPKIYVFVKGAEMSEHTYTKMLSLLSYNFSNCTEIFKNKHKNFQKSKLYCQINKCYCVLVLSLELLNFG